MANGHGSYCIVCGSPLRADQSFCTKCGAPPRQVPSGPTAEPDTRSPAATKAHITQAVATASRAYATVGQMAGLAGMGFALPWQKVAGLAQADIGAFLSAAALPGAQRAIRASLRRPGLALAATTVLDVAVAVITGGTSALYKAIPRLVLSGSTSLLSLATGSKGGAVRKATGVLGAVTGLAQLGFAAYTLISGLDAGTSAWVIAPQVVVMASSLVAATKTMALAFRRSR
jgi:hypothetical protein